MRETTLRIRHHGEPESDVSAAFPSVQINSVSSLTGRPPRQKRIVSLSGPPEEIEGFLEAFRTADAIEEARLLSPVDATPAYASVVLDARRWDSIAAQLSDLSVHYRVGTTIRNGWEHWTLYLEDDRSLGRIVDALEESGNDVELLRDVSLEAVEGRKQLALTHIADRLTDRQQEVLSVAIESGYYDGDLDVSVADVADRMGLATSTTWEHLAKAEETVMAEVADYLSATGTPP
ncbi:MAG: helix-turn-helix domain-containing protein [Halanaeroarchaeum sp.]